MLADAIVIATQAHMGQTTRDGKPYILHPLTVMYMQDSNDETAQIVAVLHDTIEDTEVSLGQLKLYGFHEEVLAALEVLTHDKEEPYSNYIERLADNPIAVKVKLADLTHNMDLSRLPRIAEKDLVRHAKYAQAYAYLMGRKK